MCKGTSLIETIHCERKGTLMVNIEQILRQTGVIPVIKLDDELQAVPLGHALLEGGIAAAEITFRTPAAAKSIEKLSAALPEMLVCAGTVLSVEQAKLSVQCGAKAVISPGTNREVVEWCLENKVPVYPGCATPTEVESAMNLGLTTVKLFPAEVAGGVKMPKALYGPYRGVKFMPSITMSFMEGPPAPGWPDIKSQDTVYQFSPRPARHTGGRLQARPPADYLSKRPNGR